MDADNSIYHKVAKPGRHKQLANVDNLINQLNSLFIGLANKTEKKTGKISKVWVKYVPQIRDLLNKVRRKELDPDRILPLPRTVDNKGRLIKPRFKVGDFVQVVLDRPVNAIGKVQQGRFRTGDYRYDQKPRKITQILTYSGRAQGSTSREHGGARSSNVLYRYLVKGIKNISYTEDELIRADMSTITSAEL